MRDSYPTGSVSHHGGALRPLSVVSAGLLLLALAACDAFVQPTPTPPDGSLLPTPPHLETETLDQLFSLAGPDLQTSGDLEILTFRCTIVEGTFCWFGGRPQGGPVPAELARRVVDQVGAKAIENANRNEAAVECSRPIGGGVTFCEIDWGWGSGREPLPVE